ncbi:hypothetical protein GGR50DRAFT_697356 [Xylaria sp. CBS 124048]|nr:hypothetical protein GGR50DRAFT_697356 [Xylaria sp. CBS 124048]
MAVRQQARLFQVAAEELPTPLPSLEEVFACDEIIATRQGACDISCEVTIVYSAYTCGANHASTMMMIVEFVESLPLADFACHPRRYLCYLRSIREQLCAQITGLRQIPNPNIVRFTLITPRWCPCDESTLRACRRVFYLFPSSFQNVYSAYASGNGKDRPRTMTITEYGHDTQLIVCKLPRATSV